MSTERISRDYDEPRRPRNEWQAKRQAAWRSADQFRYRQMNREHGPKEIPFTDESDVSTESEAEVDTD